MKMLHQKRLLKLASFLRTVPKKNFDLRSYTGNSEFYIDADEIIVKELNNLKKTKFEFKCNTTACAVGWTPNVFPRTFYWNEQAEIRCKNSRRNDYDNYDYVSEHNTDEESVGEFFGLNTDEYSYLFYPGEYRKGHRGPLSVAGKIEKFVESKRKNKEYKVKLKVYGSALE